MDFIEPLKYPLKDIKKLVVGGLMVLPGIFLLLIPFIIASGYFIRVAESTIKGQNEPPEFDNWKNLFVKGLGFILICIVYTIIFYLVLLLALLPAIFFSSVSTYTSYGYSSLDTLANMMAIIFFFIALIPLIISLIMNIIALVKYGENGSVGEGFKFMEIWRNFRKNLGNYSMGYILFFGVYLVLAILYSMFFMLISSVFVGAEIIGGDLGAIVEIIIVLLILGILGIICFYLYLFLMRMFAQIYKESKLKLGEDSRNIPSQPETAFNAGTEQSEKQ